jgi:putative addiction module component (TIGR02574 family)
MASAEDHVRALRKFPPEDRARAARQVLDGLDNEGEDSRAEQAWAVEIERRLARIEAGQAKRVPMDERPMTRALLSHRTRR